MRLLLALPSAVIIRLDLVWQGPDLDEFGTYAGSSWRSFIFLLIRGEPSLARSFALDSLLFFLKGALCDG